MVAIQFDRENDDTAAFVAEVRAAMPLDAKILNFFADDEVGMEDFWDNSRSRFFRNLCYFVALGGFLPTRIKKLYEAGNLYQFNAYPWCGEGGLNLPELDPADKHDWAEIAVICDRTSIKSREKRELLVILEGKGLPIYSLNDLYAMKMAEVDVTEEDFVSYLSNIGGKHVDGEWIVKFKKYTQLTLSFNKENSCWVYHEGGQKLEFRDFYAINGIPTYGCPHKIALLALNYLITSFDENDLKGRRAYMSGVFVDVTSVGYEHAILSRFKRNKVGLLKVGVKANNWLPLLIEDGDMIAAAKLYEALGFSVFMHKGAKYIVVSAGCTGFGRTEQGTTKVAWSADKQAKLTGRALWNVPTAAEYVDDDDD